MTREGQRRQVLVTLVLTRDRIRAVAGDPEPPRFRELTCRHICDQLEEALR